MNSIKRKKLKLIREAENSVGFARFKVNTKSSEEDLDEVLTFIRTAKTELDEYICPKMDELYGDDE